MIGIARARHCVGGSNYHLQFPPKYRRRIFLDPVLKEACSMEFQRIAEELNIKIEALEFGPDHLHIFLSGCKNYSACELARRFKGASSRALRKLHGGRLKRFRMGSSLWSDGYFYESVGRVTSSTVKFYIERQQGKHWMHEDADVSTHSYREGKPTRKTIKQGFQPRITERKLTVASFT
ncbi:MAG: IS200/IS605 family transposase [Thermoplasmata archaeon]